jgi:hypothetical protein
MIIKATTGDAGATQGVVPAFAPTTGGAGKSSLLGEPTVMQGAKVVPVVVQQPTMVEGKALKREALPPPFHMWEKRATPEGIPYFANTVTESTSWADPRSQNTTATLAEQQGALAREEAARRRGPRAGRGAAECARAPDGEGAGGQQIQPLMEEGRAAAAEIQAKVHGMVRSGQSVTYWDAVAYGRSLTPEQKAPAKFDGYRSMHAKSCRLGYCSKVCCPIPGAFGVRFCSESCTGVGDDDSDCLCYPAFLCGIVPVPLVLAVGSCFAPGYSSCVAGVAAGYSCCCWSRKPSRDRHSGLWSTCCCGASDGTIMLVDHERGTLACYTPQCQAADESGNCAPFYDTDLRDKPDCYFKKSHFLND